MVSRVLMWLLRNTTGFPQVRMLSMPVMWIRPPHRSTLVKISCEESTHWRVSYRPLRARLRELNTVFKKRPVKMKSELNVNLERTVRDQFAQGTSPVEQQSAPVYRQEVLPINKEEPF